MKKWAFSILVMLILGVVTTVGVAWGLAWRPTEPLSPHAVQRSDFEEPGRIHLIEMSALGRTRVIFSRSILRAMVQPAPVTIHRFAALGDMYSQATNRRDHVGLDEFTLPPHFAFRAKFDEIVSSPRPSGGWHIDHYVDDQFGWPDRCLRCRSMIDNDFYGTNHWRQMSDADAFIFAEKTDSVWPEGPVLPLRPILPGFIINTVFYAVIWFGVFFGVAALRRFVRRKRGRCVKCGYDLRGQRSAVSDQREDGDPNSALTSDLRSLTSGIGCPECGWGRES